MKNSNLSFTQFADQFRACNRHDQFSFDGLKALYEYLTELEESIGEEIELDVIALCCDYSEHDAESLWNDYGQHIDGVDDQDDLYRYLEDNTVIIPVGESNYLIQSF